MSEYPPANVATPAPPTRIRWLVLVLACLTSWLLYLHRYSWGVIKPEVKSEFGFSDTRLGWLDSAFNLSYALFQVPGGLLGDWLGPAIVLPVIIFAWSGCVAGTAMVGQAWSFAGVRTLFGLTQAGAYVFAGLCWLAIDATRKVFTVGTTPGTAPSSEPNA